MKPNPEDDKDEYSNEEYSPERNEDGTWNEARERSLEKNARRVYEEELDYSEYE